MNTRFLKLSEALIIIIVILLCLLIIFLRNGNNGKSAIISINGKTAAVIPLSKESEHFSVKGADNIFFTVHNGCIYVDSSDCTDKICMKTGKINKCGESIICLPKKVSVTISDSTENADVIVG